MSWAEAFVQLVTPFLQVVALVVSLVGIALGLALALWSAATLRALQPLNRWVSSRRAIKPLEVPRSAGVGGNRMLGAGLALIGLYALLVLVPGEVSVRLADALGVDPRRSFAGFGIDFARWLLVAGSALAACAGLLMLLAPRAFAVLEARSAYWVSSRRLAAGGDTLHLPLERFAQRHPRLAGFGLAALSAAAAIASLVLLLPRS